MSLELKPFDPAHYLTDDETIAYYLIDALEENDARAFAHALGDVVQALGGVSRLSQRTGLSENVLTAAASETGNPELTTILTILGAFRIKVTASRSEAAGNPVLTVA